MGLAEIQRNRELQAVQAAVDACKAEQQRLEKMLQPADWREGRDFLRSTVLPLADAVRRERQAIAASGAKLPTHGLAMLSLGELTLALVALRTIFNRVALRNHWEPTSYADVAVAIGRSCYWERRRRMATNRCASERDPELPDLRRLLAGRRMKGAIDRFETLDPSADRWVALGATMLNLAEELSIVVVVGEGRGQGAIRRIRLGEALAQRQERFERDPLAGLVVVPAHRPMIVPPRPWTGLYGGGFLTSDDPNAQEPEIATLVKHHGHPKQRDALERSAMRDELDTVYSAVNALQATPWRVNARVHAVMRRAWNDGIALPGLPDRGRLQTLAEMLDPLLKTRASLMQRAAQLRRRESRARKTFALAELSAHAGPHPDCAVCAALEEIERLKEELRVDWEQYHAKKGALDVSRRELQGLANHLKERKRRARLAHRLRNHGGPHPECAACAEVEDLGRLEAELKAAQEDHHRRRAVLDGDAKKSFPERLRERTRLSVQVERIRRLLAECDELDRDAGRIGSSLADLQLFVPWQIDHRGRAYSMISSLNPQGNDHARALLEFGGEGKPLDDRGRYWLAVHTANMYGKDKLPFAERVAWTKAHAAQIGDLAHLAQADGAANAEAIGGLSATTRTFWEGADEKKAWQFLAACFEWTDSGAPKFVSRLPIVLDASASGLQHLSAVARDEDGAAATNLIGVAADGPQDIYQRVANRLQPIVDREAMETGGAAQHAAAWRGRINRKVVKQGVMTTPYGVTDRGRTKQVFGVMQDDETFPILHDAWTAADYLAERIGSCIEAEVRLAHAVMVWLRDLAATLAGFGRGVAWTTPAGLPVVVWNYPYSDRPVKIKWTEMNSRTPRELALRVPISGLLGIDADEQKDTIAPNFVHSLDAAHMMLTIARLAREGLTHFVAIHDSFGVHAPDVDHMRRVLREEFVEMYRPSLLDQLVDEQIASAGHPEIVAALLSVKERRPVMGNLKIELVLESEYMFS